MRLLRVLWALASVSVISQAFFPTPLLPCRCPASSVCLNAKTKRNKSSKLKPKNKASSGGSSGFGGATKSSKLEVASQIQSALDHKLRELRKSPETAQLWLEVGAVLMKAKEFAEAERVFRAATIKHPGVEMLSAAALTLGGDSAAYYHGDPVGFNAAPKPSNPPPDLGDDAFESFEAPLSEITVEDQADRAVEWSKGSKEWPVRGVVHRSKAPLLDSEECDWVIQQVEAHAAASGGWSTARHVEAPTTDVPVSQVPAIRDWFDSQLKEKLFPMLHHRYPTIVPSPRDLRVMDAFVVRYDAGEQASLPVHQDENVLSFTIALNSAESYEGGGTSFERLRPVGGESHDQEFAPTTVRAASAGTVVTFPGKLRHGGSTVTRGRRYIIPLFIYLDTNASGKAPGYLTSKLPPVEVDETALSRYVSQVGGSG